MRIEHLELTDSTNEVLKRKKDKQEYDLVYADNQTDSRGRRGNKWVSDKGAALFSFLLKDNDYAEKLIFACRKYDSHCFIVIARILYNNLPYRSLKSSNSSVICFIADLFSSSKNLTISS